MTELMRLYNTYLGPSSDTLLDLGAPDFRWNNAYLFGTVTGNTVTANSLKTIAFVALGSATMVGVVATAVTVNTMSIGYEIVTSSNITSGVFGKAAVSSLVLSNNSSPYVNIKMLTHNAASPASGDVWFFASSNQVYLALRSNNATYYVAMAT